MVRALSVRLALQAAAMKVSANIVVQLITLWRKGPDNFTFDWQQVLEFAIYGSFNSQLSNVIQYLLEDWFPTTTGLKDDPTTLPKTKGADEIKQLEEKKHDDSTPAAAAGQGWTSKWRRCCKISPDVSWFNLLAKLFLDQTIGLFISGCVFIFVTNVARVPHPSLIVPIIEKRVFSLIKAGWHIWPLVALCNFLWVPVRSRVLVAVFVGFGWSIFLSVFAMRN